MRNATIAACISYGMVAAGVAQQEGGSASGTVPGPELVERIEELGGRVAQVARSDPGLEVSFHLGRSSQGVRQLGDSIEGDSEPLSLDSGLAALKRLQNVISVHLGGTDVTDVGLSHLAGLTSLKRLHLEKTKLSDAGLAQLAGLESLTYLNLYGTAVTDAGLKPLEGLKRLRSLYLWQTQATPEGTGKLQEALPDCDINLGWEEKEEAEEPDA